MSEYNRRHKRRRLKSHSSKFDDGASKACEICKSHRLENMRDSGIETFIECGPGKTLSGLVKKTLKGVKICRVENIKTLESTLEALSEEQ